MTVLPGLQHHLLVETVVGTGRIFFDQAPDPGLYLRIPRARTQRNIHPEIALIPMGGRIPDPGLVRSQVPEWPHTIPWNRGIPRCVLDYSGYLAQRIDHF